MGSVTWDLRAERVAVGRRGREKAESFEEKNVRVRRVGPETLTSVCWPQG